MSEKRERVFYRVYEVMPDGSEEYYAEADGFFDATLYADQIDLDTSEFGGNQSAIYKVTEIEEKVN